ncbi:CDP-glycerol glycerophosphotransferase family protein [Bacillus changyiensis]|uniref:CDP-glycerol glycerophosphotransferase family protein n=1 Tax=Bacillus changyiensis TaxID=3004103 RepID=UPI0022E6E612|nr:CDP-glycerol glycerophosphotransferase family protein [Bacillus changyiensis]MDA1476603.1 CDP-glycerol glycerophosphotransferase family protein [Bacillus changyiensis]
MNIRSLLTMVYSVGLSLIGFMFKWVKPRDKAVLLVSFPDNARALLKEYENSKKPFDLEVLYTRHAIPLKEEYPSVKAKVINEKNPFHLIQAVYTMFSSKFVICDNYFLLTSTLNNRSQTTCIQVWHANGALKKFGLEDVTNQQRNPRDIKRFNQVYRSFDYVVVGSDKMADIFKRSFGIKDDQRFLRTGVPLTDQYFQAPQSVSSSNKKIILYAPTYRDFNIENIALPFSKEQLSEDLKGEFLLHVKLHPAVRRHIRLDGLEGFVKDVSDLPLKELLYKSDILISDYSSVPFEYALFHKPMLFFTYDMKEYDEKRGLIDHFESVIPGKACRNREMLLTELKHLHLIDDKTKQFAEEWNQYSQGDASRRLLEFVSQQIHAGCKRIDSV